MCIEWGHLKTPEGGGEQARGPSGVQPFPRGITSEPLNGVVLGV